MIETCLIGHGYLGRWHAQKIEQSSLANLNYIVEANESTHEEIQKIYPNAKISSNLAEAIASCEAFVIVTPTKFHYECLEKLLAAKKHIFCEKPLCENYGQVLEIEKQVADTKKIFQVGHSERFHMAWTFKEQFQDYFKGKIIVNIERTAAFKGRATDVDVVSDLMIHDLDLVRFVTGLNLFSVKAIGIKSRTNKWDHVQASFEAEQGSSVNITSGRIGTIEKRYFEVVCELGSLFVDLLNGKIYSSNRESLEVREIDFEARDHLKLEHENFYQSINNSSRPKVGFEEGKLAVYLVSKVHESLENRKSVEI